MLDAIVHFFTHNFFPDAQMAILGSIASGLALGGGSALVSGLLGGDKEKVRQRPLRSPEQTEAQNLLLDFAKSGRFGDFQAGEPIGVPLGDFDPTGLEQAGLQRLGGLLQEGLPSTLGLAVDSLGQFLDTGQENIDRQFQPFQQRTERLIGEQEDALKRGAAFTGDLFSSDTIEQLGDVRSRGLESLTSELARLTDQARQRQLQAIPLAGNLAQLEEGLNLGRIGASQQFGGLERILSDQAIQAQLQEALRQRGELRAPISAAQTLATAQPAFGVPEVDIPVRSPFQNVLDLTAGIGGDIISNELFLRRFNELGGNTGGGGGGVAPGNFSGFGSFTGPLSLPGFL